MGPVDVPPGNRVLPSGRPPRNRDHAGPGRSDLGASNTSAPRLCARRLRRTCPRFLLQRALTTRSRSMPWQDPRQRVHRLRRNDPSRHRLGDCRRRNRDSRQCYDPDRHLTKSLARGTLPIVEPDLDELSAPTERPSAFTATLLTSPMRHCLYRADVPTDDLGESDLTGIRP